MGFSRLARLSSGRESERGFARATPRHFLDAAPNSRDRPLSLKIVGRATEVNALDEVV